MTNKTPITIAYGDGIGPEIMQATLKILAAANAQIEPEVIEIGEKVYREGFTSGIPDSAWASLKRTKVLLKGPITTPQGGGYKSLNVTLRKTLGLYANVRPCFTLAPYVTARCAKMDLVIIRENEEDTYSGIEYRLTHNLYECLKIVTRPGCERIIRYAFEYARKFNRKKVACFSKDNIMKMTDGLFHETFNRIAKEYPDIINEHYIVDIGTALLATEPERFDVIVTLNLYGDIISDVAAQVAGSVGLAGSANIGNDVAMFEAIHGSAPDIAGKNKANPSGLLNGAIQMLIHINQPHVASLVENAWLKTIEEGIHTGDIHSSWTHQKVGTMQFADAVIANLGNKPQHFTPADYQEIEERSVAKKDSVETKSEKTLVGVDVYLDNASGHSVETLVNLLQPLNQTGVLELITIASRGLKMWPNSSIDSPHLSQCACRFQSPENKAVSENDIIALLTRITAAKLPFIKLENLYLFDGQRGFSLVQGQ